MNYDRQSRVWRVRETDHCLFHLEPPVHEDPDVATVVDGADSRYLRIRELLGYPPMSVKEREIRLRLNYWLYAPSAIADADMPPGARRFAEGAGSPAGIVYGQRGFRWTECVDALEHETIHVLWGAKVGEAPSLLNEGVAVYFGARLSDLRDLPDLSDSSDAPPPTGTAWQRNYHAAWQQAITSGARSLRDFCTIAGFWGTQRPGQGPSPAEPYRIGGALVGYLVETRGLPLLEEIFLNSHYRDDHLAPTLERLTGTTIEELSTEVGAHWAYRAASATSDSRSSPDTPSAPSSRSTSLAVGALRPVSISDTRD